LDLAPVPRLRFNTREPADPLDYPYSAELAPTEAPPPGARIYLSAAGSADPEGTPVRTFWNVQWANGDYLSLEPNPDAASASFVATRPGTYRVALQVAESGGLRQISQAVATLAVAPKACAPDGVSPPCSDEVPVPAGSFLMGASGVLGHTSERPRHRAELAAYALDEYEVTVGRFRRFVDAYDPAFLRERMGAHPLIAGSGWRSEWIDTLPLPEDFAFAIEECGGPFTELPGANEARPISCVTWFEAFAFCAWEGKRLPTEAEWEYAAAGGDAQRPYPWGSEPPSPELAAYGCLFDGDASCSDADLPVAGSVKNGVNRFGHFDLAGSVWEWTLDAYAPYGESPCVNCAVLGDASTPRVFRGGDFKFDDPESLLVTTRYAFLPSFPDPTRGLRCARSLE
jgi:formylglycine-generating enzyme required for sulfatase activity